MAKGDIARFQQFLLLSQCFQMSSAADASTCVYMSERIMNVTHLESRPGNDLIPPHRSSQIYPGMIFLKVGVVCRLICVYLRPSALRHPLLTFLEIRTPKTNRHS